MLHKLAGFAIISRPIHGRVDAAGDLDVTGISIGNHWSRGKAAGYCKS